MKTSIPEFKYVDFDDPSIEVIAGKLDQETIARIKRIILDILYKKHMGYSARIKRGSLLIDIMSDWHYEYDSYLLLTDRRMREIIEELRTGDVMGSRICSTPGNKGGYFIAMRRRELLANLVSDLRLALAILRRITAQRRNSIKAFAINDFDQLEQVSLFTLDTIDA